MPIIILLLLKPDDISELIEPYANMYGKVCRWKFYPNRSNAPISYTRHTRTFVIALFDDSGLLF